MKNVVFGLTVSSSWGNGHATTVSDIFVAADAADATAAIDTDDGSLARIGRAGRARTPAEHTSDHRACALTAALESARTSARVPHMAEA
jgi:hypothetical protein